MLSQSSLNRKLRVHFGHLGRFFGASRPKIDNSRPCYRLQNAKVFSSRPSVNILSKRYSTSFQNDGSHSGRGIDRHRLDERNMMRTYACCSPTPIGPIKVGMDRPDISRSRIPSSFRPMPFRWEHQNSWTPFALSCFSAMVPVHPMRAFVDPRFLSLNE